MITQLGGDRLGRGGKQDIHMKNYGRSTHNLSATWRSTMASGTLVPFMNEAAALPGDKWSIDLDCNVLTLPTIGPLFGSYKVQLDVFSIPYRLFNASLHMNKLNIGLDMSQIKLPQVEVKAFHRANFYSDNSQINPSSIFKYLGISGIGGGQRADGEVTKEFNAVPYLSYWSIYKNYYASKSEQRGMVIHTGQDNEYTETIGAYAGEAGQMVDCYNTTVDLSGINKADRRIEIEFDQTATQPDFSQIMVKGTSGASAPINQLYNTVTFPTGTGKVVGVGQNTAYPSTFDTQEVETQSIRLSYGTTDLQISEFPLENIDKMREKILQHPQENGTFVINATNDAPYNLPLQLPIKDKNNQDRAAAYFTQEGLGLKTYQSDLFNNWMEVFEIDGPNGINELTSVSTSGDSFSIDSLNIANKVYNMLNRIAISGGSYDDWLKAVYTGERARSVESPVYHGSLIKELAFQEVVSNAAATDEPLGTLAGRGKLTGKNKGGKMTIDVTEPSVIMGIVSLTPRLDYSQGNKWDMNLKTMNDFHKPELSAIGFQDLITTQMAWSDSDWNNTTQTETLFSAGKQPAWLNYMTEVNRTYGNFASEVGDPDNGNGQMWMTLNRKYEIDPETGKIQDLTQYIDPSKFNEIFAESELDAQNFWVQIQKNVTVRRKMSAKIIPNL
jgi:hypothetical protein